MANNNNGYRYSGNDSYINRQADNAARDKAKAEAQMKQWEKDLNWLAASNKMTDESLLGFALGKLLKQGFDSWKGNYDQRNNDKILRQQQAQKEVYANNANEAMSNAWNSYATDTIDNIAGEYTTEKARENGPWLGVDPNSTMAQVYNLGKMADVFGLGSTGQSDGSSNPTITMTGSGNKSSKDGNTTWQEALQLSSGYGNNPGNINVMTEAADEKTKALINSILNGGAF